MGGEEVNIKILARRTGLGNQIQFIPCIKELKRYGYVYTDSSVYSDLDIIPVDDCTPPDRCYMPYNYRRNWVLREKLKYPKAKFYGYIGKKSKIVRWLIKGVEMDHNNMELWNNTTRFVSTEEEYLIPGWKPVKNRIALCVSDKTNKYYKYWHELIDLLIQDKWDPHAFGSDILKMHTFTPTIRWLKQELSRCEYHISTDNGPAHLADALGIPGLTIWGDSKLRGALQNSVIVMGLNSDPKRVFNIFKSQVVK